MKTLLLSLVILVGSQSIAAPGRDCASRAQLASRAMWSVNSGIDMKDLSAELGRIVNKGQNKLLLEVFVNTGLQGFPQKVPYSVAAVQKTNGNCFIESVTALQSYGSVR